MSGNRLRVLSDWTLNAITRPETISFEVVSAASVPLDANKPRALMQDRASHRRKDTPMSHGTAVIIGVGPASALR